MTTKPTAPKFRIRRKVSRPLTPAAPTGPGASEDGFGDAPFPGSAKAEAQKSSTQDLADIRREGLTGRQLRMARRLAQKHGLTPASDFDAVRLLRAKGVDPFDRAAMLELVVPDPDKTDAAADVRAKAAAAAAAQAASTARPVSKPQDSGPTPVAKAATAKVPADQANGTPNVPQTVPDQANPNAFLPGHPATPGPVDVGLHELERIQRDIARRRRRRLAWLTVRLIAFVAIPTLLVGLYFAFVATPSYTTHSEFVIEQADNPQTGGLLSGTSFANSQDSIVVQDFLQSREAMLRLNEEHGYRDHASQPDIDWWQRLPADASNEDAYAHYRRNVKLGYDPTEGVIRMEVTAFDPAISQQYSEALIGYAEERIDGVSEGKRSRQMADARATFDEAETQMVEAQEAVVQLQKQLGVVDPASETAGLMGQIATFETQLAEKRLQLQQLLDNARPNQARVSGVEGDIVRLEALIRDLRSELTVNSAEQGSLAETTARLRMAETDLETRTAMMQEALRQLETARIEAERQVRYLLVGISPVPPDVPTAPKVFNATFIAFLLFAGIYLIASLTIAILREQVSS